MVGIITLNENLQNLKLKNFVISLFNMVIKIINAALIDLMRQCVPTKTLSFLA